LRGGEGRKSRGLRLRYFADLTLEKRFLRRSARKSNVVVPKFFAFQDLKPFLGPEFSNTTEDLNLDIVLVL
jgi:hypothetical protein